MRKDPTEFRERFNAYKNGKSVKEIYNWDLPKYGNGKTDSYAHTVKFLKQHEGFKDSAYVDGNGVATIGYGFTDSALVRKGKISRVAADARLRQEVVSRDRFLSKLKNWDKLNEGSKTALRSYYYNYPAGFKDTTKFMKAWNAGDYDEAIKQVNAGMNDRKNSGLRTRRLAEQALLKADPFLSNTKAASIPDKSVPFNKNAEDPFGARQFGQVIPIAIRQYKNDAIVKQNVERDKTIANKKGYGWNGVMRTPLHTANQAKTQINPSWRFADWMPAAMAKINGTADMSGATKDDIAFWNRYIGYNRDFESMPINGIRFRGDYNQDGTPRLPQAEYTGLSRQAKDYIKAGINNGRISTNDDGSWKQFEELGSRHAKYTSHLGDYSIRENNGSGIYDIFDTYDFPWYVPIFNRQPGKQIEIRDTIHGLNARPELYDPMFSVKTK